MTKFVPGGPKRYAHQKRALRRIIETKGVTALLLDPGLGKTAVTLDYASLLALKSPTQEARVLVVCPLAAVDSWVIQAGTWVSPQVSYWAEALGGSILQKAEALAARGGSPFDRLPGAGGKAAPVRRRRGESTRAHGVRRSWATGTRPAIEQGQGPDALPGPRLVLEVLNLDALGSRRSLGSKTVADVMVQAIRRFSPDLVVVDESHRIKGPSANASRLLARIADHVRRRIILTGTVMPHSPQDVFAQWRFLQPYAFGHLDRWGQPRKATLGEFQARYGVKGGFMGREIIRWTNLDEMHRIMAQNAVVIRKEEALDLPKTTDVTVPVHLSPREAKAYAAMKADLAAVLRADDAGHGQTVTTASSRLTQMLRLRQITAGHMPDDSGRVDTIGDAKARTVASIVNETLAGERRVVVFALFRREIEDLAAALAEKGTEVLTITGETPVETRLAYRRRFGSDDPARIVLVAQIKTLSLAVNELVTASHAVFATLSQQRDDYVQARDRLNRLGQTRPVTFWHAVAPGTVDEVVLRTHQKRGDLESAILAHVRDLG